MYPPQSEKNIIDDDRAQLMTKQLLVELGLDVDSYSISNKYVWINVLLTCFRKIMYIISGVPRNLERERM